MPKRKAANNAGSVDWVETKKLWRTRVTVSDADGMTIRKAVYAKTQKEVLAKAKALEEQYRKGLVAKRDNQTFGDFADDWVKRKERSGKAINTVNGYKQDITKAKTLLGEMRLQAIKPTHVRKLLDQLGETYAHRTQAHVLRTLRGIFKQAMRLEMIYKNPAEFVEIEAPKTEPKAKSLQPHEITMLLEACPDSEMGLFFRLLLGCGLRKGEALGLKWADVNLGQGELSITKNWTGVGVGHMSERPKTKTSRRIVPIPSGLLGRFKAHNQKMLEDWTAKELTGSFIFGVPGEPRPYEVNTPNKALKRLVGRVNAAQTKLETDSEGQIPTESLPRLPELRVHDLRHTYGSIALSRGIPLEVVSERMGHANPTITLNVYRHVLEHERRGYVFDVEEMIRSASTPRAQA